MISFPDERTEALSCRSPRRLNWLYFDFALQTGDHSSFETAKDLLRGGSRLAESSTAVPSWWISRLCLHVIDDLWSHSLHQMVPAAPLEGADESYLEIRELFISSLYARKSAEVELWPSQREAAQRISDLEDDLVVTYSVTLNEIFRIPGISLMK